MKKFVYLTAMVAAMAASAEMKVGTVDLMLLVRNHPNYDSNKALLTSTDKDYQKKLEGVKAEGKVVGQVRGEKIVVFKYKSKKNYRRKQGHRQPYTKVEITKIG